MLISVNCREYETLIAERQEERLSIYRENLIIFISNYHNPQFVHSS